MDHFSFRRRGRASGVRGPNPLIAKLGRFVPLTSLDHDALVRISADARPLLRGDDLIREGDRPDSVFLLLEGWACRYKHLDDGSRQITGYLLPGDLCDIRIFLFDQMDHSIGLLSDAIVVKIPAPAVIDLLKRYPRIERATMWATLVDEATLREWLLNIGQRDAVQRLAHLFCELCVRLHVVNLVDDRGSFAMPLTQADLADTVGMTAVHVNRSLQRLRRDGLIVLKEGRLTTLDFARLADLAGFNDNYLHIDGPPLPDPHQNRLLGGAARPQ